MSKDSKMKIEIWSDVMCPFCYIGKRRFEQALSQFSQRNQLEVEWKSFQLMPDLVTDPTKGLPEMLSESKGISLSQAQEMNQYVQEMASHVGLEFHLDSSIPANTFKAHRFLHLAKSVGKQDEAEEALFKAHFTESKNIDEDEVLIQIGTSLGIDNAMVEQLLSSDQYTEQVLEDQYEARQVGVTGVPFFVFDNRQAISGAQPVELFSQTLEQTFLEWKTKN